MLEEDNLKNLSDEELLEFILPRSTAVNLIKEYSTLYNVVINASGRELSKIKGVGKEKAGKIKFVREVLNRIQKEIMKQVITIKSSENVFNCMQDMIYLQQEELRVILLNTRNGIIGRKLITKGTVNSALITPREVFSPAIKEMATNIIIVHNHPSGSLVPSPEDIKLTEILVRTGELVHIKVLDHVIIAKTGYFSMKDVGCI